MLDAIYKTPGGVKRARATAVGPRLDAFAARLFKFGYSALTVKAYVRAAVHLGRWAEAAAIQESALDRDALANFIAHRRRRGAPGKGASRLSGYCAGARRYLDFLRDEGVAQSSSTDEPGLLAEFRTWLAEHRGLANSTADRYVRDTAEMLKALGADPSSYEARSVRDFVYERCRHVSPAKAGQVVSATRTFLRFLIAMGRCKDGLDSAVPRIACWRLDAIPRYLEPEAVEQVVASSAAASSCSVGCRDHAIILLLARLGFRAADVAGLSLGDVSWCDGLVKVAGKGRQECLLPLPQEVGDAVSRYLEEARPLVDDPGLFRISRTPYHQIAPHVVSQVARRAIRRAGVEAPTHGAHVFRHSVATGLLRRGMPLQGIAELLRHTSHESVFHYAKVHADLLGSVARPWPEATDANG